MEALLPYSKTFVCFANSRKTAGRCVAGKELTQERAGSWIRPISARPTHEISLDERRYQDGRDPDLLHVVSAQCLSHHPLAHQPENHLIDAGYFWSQHGTLDFRNIDAWTDAPATLWAPGHSGYAFTNNRVPDTVTATASLYLIRVPSLVLVVGAKSTDYPKRIVRGEFTYGGLPYTLAVTDPLVEAAYLVRPDGRYTLQSPVLCVSLGDPFQGYFYKLIAAVLYDGRF
jgi:hypothetical protein